MDKRIKIVLWVAIPFVAGGILLYNKLSGSRSPETAQQTAGKGSGRGDRIVPVKVYMADYLKLDEGLRRVGTLVANEEADLSGSVAGHITGVYFDEGKVVKKGEVLVKVEDDDLQSQLRRAELQHKLLEDKLERARILLAKDAISHEAFDQVNTDYNVIGADIYTLKLRISKTEIRAPFDGVVGFRNVSVGTYLQAGQLVAHLVDYSKLKLDFSVPEKYAGEMRVGAKVHFSTEEGPSVHEASVYAIDPKVDTRTRTISVRALYNNASMRLLPGMSARVTVGQRSGESIQVPTEGIVPDANNMSVWVVRDGRAALVPVVTGIRSDNMVEIMRGLSRGDSVVVSGLLQLRDGSRVQATN